MKLSNLVLAIAFLFPIISSAAEDEASMSVADARYRLEIIHYRSTFKTLCQEFQNCQLKEVGIIDDSDSAPLSIAARIHVPEKGVFVYLISGFGLLSDVPSTSVWNTIEIEKMPNIFRWIQAHGSCLAFWRDIEGDETKERIVPMRFHSCSSVYARSFVVSPRSYSNEQSEFGVDSDRVEHMILCEVGLLERPETNVEFKGHYISGSLNAHCEEYLTAFYKI